MASAADQLSEVFRAGAPLVYCETAEDERFGEEARLVALRTRAELYSWHMTVGLRRIDSATGLPGNDVPSNRQRQGTQNRSRPRDGEGIDDLIQYLLESNTVACRAAFDKAAPDSSTGSDDGPMGGPPDVGSPVLVVAFDMVSAEQQLRPRTVRLLKDLHGAWEPLNPEARRKQLLFSGVGWTPPPELAGYVVSTHLPLPTREEIEKDLSGRRSLAGVELTTEEIADRVVGLSHPCIEFLVRRLASLSDGSDPKILIDDVKREEIRKTQLLEIARVPDGIQLGGFAGFKQWFERRKPFFRHGNQRPALTPRGVLLLGFPGCGKSHAARWIASELKLPLVAMDIGRLQSRWVGSSEARMRTALATLEAAAPVVLFIDEIEKAIAGFGTESSGVTTRLVGQILTWLADHRVPVFVVATCNTPELPPELTRAGRFDATFVVQPPTREERREILTYVAQEVKGDLEPEVCEHAVEGTNDFSGAELRQLLIEAGYVAGPGRVTYSKSDINSAIPYVRPLARRRDGQKLLRSYQEGLKKAFLDAAVPWETPR